MNLSPLLRSAGFASLLLFFSLYSLAQNFPVTGKITDADGQPLAGVTIKVKGSNLAAQTNAEGAFQINAPSPDAVLVVSYVGFNEQQVPVGNKNQLSVSMTPLQNSLENVVVVGYGTQKKKNVTGAVASFNADNLDERPVTRVDQALVGQLAGVRVNQTSGALGKGMSIQVRGTGSINAGNEPLYVIDGFPLAQASPNGAGNFATGNPLDNMNPNDIESIQVLKDASAAAIYGSRAANGVVIITTKRGKSGKAKISVNSYAGYSEANRKLDMLSAEEWADRATEMINAHYLATYGQFGAKATDTYEQRLQMLNNPPAGSDLKPANLKPGDYNTNYMLDDRWAMPGHPGLRYIDWQKEAFRKGVVQNHQVSASGGNEFVKYYVSGNFADQEGMVKGMDFRSYSARANVEVNASKNLKFGLNVSPSYSIINDPGVEGKDNILHQLVSMTPVQEDSMGLYPNVGNNGQYRWSTSPNSPYGKLEQIVGQTKRFRTLTSLFAEYQLVQGLALKTTLNFDNIDNNSGSYVPYTIAGNLVRRSGPDYLGLISGTFNTFRRQTFVNENTLSYNKVYNDVHDVLLLAGASYNLDKLDRSELRSQNGYTNAIIKTLNAAAGYLGSSFETRNVLLSYFGRVQYGFNDKYLFSASIRRDGSSRFGADTKWGWFPSASAAWRISEEDFMKNSSQVSDLKLRVSWGKSGNYNIGDYSAQALLGTSNYTFNNAPAFGQAPATLNNRNLSWEKSESFDVGLDVGVLNNRITASLDYYTKLNTDLLLNVPVPAVTGFTSSLTNIGKVKNQGWEIELTSRNLVGELQWTTSANLSHNRNKVLALGEGQTQILVPSAFDISHSILQVGKPMNSIYVVRQDGILSRDDIDKGAALYGAQTVGDPRYVDANGDGVIDADDRVIVGHPNPDYVWGVTNNLRYKGFDLSVLVQGQWGGSIYSMFGRAVGRTGQGFTDNALGFYRDRWRSEADPGDGKVSKAYSTFGRIKNTDWLYSSDYLRVRNITLGYDLGRLVKGKVVSGARIYATAENFFGFDKYKGGFNPEANNTDVSGSSIYPEAGDYGGLPLPRSLIFGLNLTF